MQRSSASAPRARPARQVVAATVVTVLIVAGFWTLIQRLWLVAIVFLGVVLGIAIEPGARWLRRRGIPEVLAVILIYLGLLLVAAAVTALLVPVLTEQIRELASNLPDDYRSLRAVLTRSPNWLVRRLGSELPPLLEVSPNGAPAPDAAFGAVGTFLAAMGTATSAALGVLAVFVIGFYWTLESRWTVQNLLLLAPMDRRGEVEETVTAVQAKVGGFVRAQAVLSAVVGALSLAGYLIVGLPYALVLALMAALFESVPMLGPVLAAVPAILVGLSISPLRALWVAALAVVIQQLESNVLGPRIVGSFVGVHPVVTLLAVVAFGALFGLPGVLLAIPLAAVVQLLLDRYVLRPAGAREGDTGRGRIGALRYEVQDLAGDMRRQAQQPAQSGDDRADEVADRIEQLALELDALLAEVGQQGDER